MIGSPYGWSWRLAEFLSGVLFGSRPRALESHIIYINWHGSGQGCAFGGSHRYISSHGGVIPPKPFILGIGFSGLNVTGVSRHRRNILWRLIARNAHLGKMHNVQSEKVGDGVISGVKFTLFCKNSIQWGFQAKTPCWLTIRPTTVRPIFTCSILIDSAGQVKNYWNFKNVQNFIQGEQPENFHTITPCNIF
jgi:hypothetical protein